MVASEIGMRDSTPKSRAEKGQLGQPECSTAAACKQHNSYGVSITS